LRLINDKPFASKKEASHLLKIHISTINKYLDTNKFYLKNNHYFYFSSKILKKEEMLRLQNLLKLQKLIVPVANDRYKQKLIYVYDANLRLINNEPFPSIDGKNGLRDYLKINRITIKKYLDTNKPYLKNNNFFYFSSKILTKKEKRICFETNLLDSVRTPHSSEKSSIWKPINVWIYRKNTNDKLVPYNNNNDEPTFTSIKTAAAEIGCDRGTISKNIRAGLNQKPLRGFYFFDEKQEI
jgi:hypothetical protein